jgi:hypothetical protein
MKMGSGFGQDIGWSAWIWQDPEKLPECEKNKQFLIAPALN